ncbi:molybdate ABC transporter substrate-binding protein [Parasporobacterium paucivorans]|uniref:Molybdate transport system substrate-binding protein n=1 Tax=Parasporobacterium paucivorans DSM 15970 TaxID=1122934 RepID=A0A1M6C9N3_9FIRM|nr:molybdate ABC transporter substrate-binding protein [Parasporobacterium paucivorans]SHI57719.1 molybdate transport system substrate-binding protein [Parasporobacterium paucivorans DSM 15970]
MKLLKKTLMLVLALLMVGGSLAACGSNEEETTTAAETTTQAAVPATINVFIAASLKNAMTQLQTMYNEEHPEITIVYNPDSSGKLQTQIQEGAECDIFFSAAAKQMNELNAGGFIKTDSIVNLLENKIVLIKGKGTETTVTGFENVTNAASIALGGEGVPVGDYARTVFANLGMTDKVNAMEINLGSDVTAVLTAVSEGSNEVGVVYATDAQSMPDSVEVIAEAPAGSMDPAVYPAALVENALADETQADAAAAFLAFLQTDAAKAVFEQYGFSIGE